MNGPDSMCVRFGAEWREVVSSMERLGARSKTAYRGEINRFNPTPITPSRQIRHQVPYHDFTCEVTAFSGLYRAQRCFWESEATVLTRKIHVFGDTKAPSLYKSFV